MLAELSSDYVEKAYQSNDEHFPFGIEFLRKATFREVNFGEQDFFEGNTIEIAAKKVSRNGFMVCNTTVRLKYRGTICKEIELFRSIPVWRVLQGIPVQIEDLDQSEV